MKVLVTYFSQTENTAKIARGIYEQAAKTNEADMIKIEDVDEKTISDYEMVFIGSPLHSAELAAPVKTFVSKIKGGSIKKIAGFITHFAPAYPDQSMEEFAKPIQTACTENGIEYKGCFDCQGALVENLHEPVKKKLNASDEEWAEKVKQMTGRPNDEDVRNAEAFARRVLQ